MAFAGSSEDLFLISKAFNPLSIQSLSLEHLPSTETKPGKQPKKDRAWIKRTPPAGHLEALTPGLEPGEDGAGGNRVAGLGEIGRWGRLGLKLLPH